MTKLSVKMLNILKMINNGKLVKSNLVMYTQNNIIYRSFMAPNLTKLVIAK